MSTQFQGNLEEIFSGASTSAVSRWTAANYVDKVLAANPSTPCLYWKPGVGDVSPSDARGKHFEAYGKCRPIPGLPNAEGWDGIEVFAGKVFVWRDDLLKWSARNDFANWVPVATTATTGRGLVVADITQPSSGQTSDFVYLDKLSGAFSVGQFVRNVAYETDPSYITYSYYQVAAVSRSYGSETQSIPTVQVADRDNLAVPIYLTSFPAWEIGIRLSVDSVSTPLQISAKSRDISVSYLLDANSDAIANIDEDLTISLASFPFELRAGDVVSIGVSDMPGQDLFRVKEVARAMRVTRLGIGERKLEMGGRYQAGSYVRFQPWVAVDNKGAATTVPSNSRLSVADGIRVVPLDLTGGFVAGQAIPGGSVFETVDANEAGELRNVGNGVSGPIYTFVTLSDFGLILKRDSIQSVQDVAREAGSIYLRGEIFGEGPIGRYAWCRFADRDVVFWGRKGWYKLSGGQTIQQVGLAHWNACHAELNASRADEIVAFHSRSGNEVWFAYPTVSGQTKVAIYNYESDSVVTDVYDESLHGITSLGEIDWELSQTWEATSPLELVNSRSKRWYEYTSLGERPHTIIGIGGDLGNEDNGEDPAALIPRLLLHGRVFTRSSRDDCDPQPYECLAETPDFDFGQPEIWKYVDTIYLHVHVPVALGATRTLKVQVGGRSSLSADVVWSAETTVDVQGGTAGPVTLKANCRGSGRLIRLRFRSDDASVQWRISAYRIIARAGNTY